MPKSPNSGLTKIKTLDNVACPFCALLCDDLSLQASHDEFEVVRNGCLKADLGFAQPRSATPALVNGTRASLSAATSAAALLLKRAKLPLFSGLGTDVEGLRETLRLAEAAKGIVDHADSGGLDSGMRVLQSRGWYLTTLSECRNRADLVILVGPDLVNHYTNFVRRCIAPKQTLAPKRGKQRRVFYLGDKNVAPPASRAVAIETIPCDPADLAMTVNTLRALTGNRDTGGTRHRGVNKQLKALAALINTAQYPVFVWAPGHLVPDTADLVIGAVTRFIGELNETQRAAGLTLGGDNGAASAANVCAWQTGYPLHVSFAGRTIEYDPVRYRSSRLIEHNAIDALLWIDAFGQAPAPATQPDVKRILIGGPLEDGRAADVYIPVGVPGLDHGGRLVRTDSVVSIKVDQLRSKPMIGVRKVIADIAAHW